MNVYLNLWGGEGFLTCTSLLAMASVGMFDGLKDNAGNNMDLIYRCMDFATQSPDDAKWQDMAKAYVKYHQRIFGAGGNVVCFGMNINGTTGSVTIDNSMSAVTIFSEPKTLFGKTGNKENLAIGCSESDIDLDIGEGIYGKPWIGEVYHSNSNFATLYPNLPGGSNIVVINCGGYKGGGTAATFVPLENKESIVGAANIERFNVLAGPSTMFEAKVKIPNNAIYTAIAVPAEVDLFKVPQMIKLLEKQSVSGQNAGLHDANIAELHKAYKAVCDLDTGDNYESLDPKYYMARFIDRMRSDDSYNTTKAIFVNMKPNLHTMVGTDEIEYDITSRAFQKDKQKHQIHITNLLNAVTIQEIAVNHSDYGTTANPRGIYTFAAPSDNAFTIDNVFLPNDANKLYCFIASAIVLTKFVYPYFNDINMTGAPIMIDNWARSHKKMFQGIIHDLSGSTPEADDNIAFSSDVKQALAAFLSEYMLPTLEVFMDVEETSKDVCFFSRQPINQSYQGGAYGIIKQLIQDIRTIANTPQNIPSEVVRNTTEELLASIFMGKAVGHSSFDGMLSFVRANEDFTGGFISYFQDNFPSFGEQTRQGRIWPSDTIAKKNMYAGNYCIEIVRATLYTVHNYFKL